MITEKDVRAYVADSTQADNDGLDLYFSTEEIADAMKRAARMFNSVPPLILSVTADTLPDDTNIFLDATAAQLFTTELNKLTRRDIDYSAGGVQAPIERARINHLKNLIEFHTKLFMEAAKPFKVSQNINRAYRHYR